MDRQGKSIGLDDCLGHVHHRFGKSRRKQAAKPQFNLLESNELLACYFCGTAMNWNGHLHRDDLNTHFSEGIDALLDVAVFTTLGTVLPWDLWHSHDTQVTLGKLVLYGISVLLIRRLPFVVGLQKFIPEIRSWREAGFVGWFGPMGIGALYYALESGELSHTVVHA